MERGIWKIKKQWSSGYRFFNIMALDGFPGSSQSSLGAKSTSQSVSTILIAGEDLPLPYQCNISSCYKQPLSPLVKQE